MRVKMAMEGMAELLQMEMYLWPGGRKGTIAYLYVSHSELWTHLLNLRLRGAWAVTGPLVMCMAVFYAEHAVHGCLRCRDIGLEGYWVSLRLLDRKRLLNVGFSQIFMFICFHPAIFINV